MTVAQTKLTTTFWVIVVIAVLWNLIGFANFIAQVTMSAGTFAALPEAERALYEQTPFWALLAFALAVFSGLGGAMALVLRKSVSTSFFSLSLVGVIVQMIYNFVIANTMAVYGPGSIGLPIVVLLIALALVWYSNAAKKKGAIA